MSFKTKVLPYFRHWTKTAVVAAAQAITDIANLWGYWRSDTGINGKLAVDASTTDEYLESSSDSLMFNSDEPWSISIWIGGLQSKGAANPLIHNLENTGALGYGVGFGVESNEAIIKTDNGALLYPKFNTTFTDDDFHHLVYTYDGSKLNTGFKMYVDGTEVTQSGSTSSGTPDDITYSVKQFRIDGKYFAGASDANCKYDQVIIFNKALDEDTYGEITALYNTGTGIKHRDLTGSETFYSSIAAWYDYDSPKNFGRESSQQTHAVDLSGTLDYFNITHVASNDFDLEYTDSFSGTAWIKFDSTSRTIFSKQENSGNFRGYIFYLNASSILEFGIYNTATVGIQVDTNNTLNTDEWYHVSFSYDGSGNASGVKLYVNGVDDTNSTPIQDDLASNTIANTIDFNIGARDGTGVLMDGTIDQISFYDTNLSASTINSLYNNGAPLNYADLSAAQKTNLVSHWDFNEQDNTIIGQDSHTNLNHLTPNSIAEADLVGGVGSLDLTENGIDSSNAVAGVVVGQVINQENVFSWTDLSGNSNDLEQSTIANQPIFDENKGIRFTGSEFLITSGNAGIATDFTVFIVGQFTDITEATALLKTSADLISKDTSGKIKNDFATTPNASTTALVNDTNKIFAVRLEDGVAGDYWFDGTQGDSITDTTNNTTDAALRLINTTLTGTAFIDSVVVYQRSLTDAEMADVFTDLNNRFSVY